MSEAKEESRRPVAVAAVPLVRDAWLILGTSLLLLLLLEVGLDVAFAVKDRVGSKARALTVDERATADAYADAPWVADYYREFSESFAARWQPYVYTRRKPYRGKYINVDEHGIRATTNATTEEAGDTQTLDVFVFGGSTVWGTGARDAHTIPSEIAAALSDGGRPARVVNFGQSGYVTTQELIELMVQLQRGNVPDLAIFYHGANDVFSAYQQNVAGYPQNEANRVREFGSSLPSEHRRMRRFVLERELKRTSIWRLARGIRKRLSTPHAHDQGSTASLQKLARQVVEVYVGNMRSSRALAREHGFEVLFYWQPTAFRKPTLTAYEERSLTTRNEMKPLFEAVHSEMEDRKAEWSSLGFHDISEMFASERNPMFIDWCHLGEHGNRVVAERIARDVSQTPL